MRLKGMFLLVAVIAGTAGAQDRKTERLSKMEQRREFVTRFAAEPKSSVPFSRSYDFEPLGRHTVLLYESMSRAYLVEIEDFCPDLPTAMAIGVDNKTSTLNAKFDALRIGGRSCKILEIRPVDVKAMKAAQKAEREAAKAGT
ncbi:DUF6491 family protein [Arenimonas sp. GDDSR-1]|uniref:DUF6491 family protein n=1 Tax=Arenimonas sp. GDDSR-1 TaxID=2950125 RepID=UPI002626C703|nr:DUF6491 family protein [Arenimonas sp. GDDSR-1]